MQYANYIMFRIHMQVFFSTLRLLEKKRPEKVPSHMPFCQIATYRNCC